MGVRSSEDPRVTGRAVDPRLARLAIALAFVGGYVDAVGFIALAHVFTGHVTGNTVMLGIDVAEGHWNNIIRRSLAIVMFLAGIVLGAVLNGYIVRRGMRSRFAPALMVEVALLVPLTLGDGALPHPATQAPRPGWALYGLVALAATALGLQNGTLRKVGSATVHTTYISGVVTTLTEGALARWFQRRDQRPHPSSTPADAEARSSADAERAKLLLLAGIASSFAAGALVGAALYMSRGLASLAVPLGLLLVLAVIDWRRPLAAG